VIPEYVAAPDAPRGLISTADAIARYCEVRPRLPTATHPPQSTHVHSLIDLVDEFDLFVLDGFGVLNVGNEAIAGAAESVAHLRAAGRTVVVLTNGAGSPAEQTAAKYQAWHMDFDRAAVVSSRDALVTGLNEPAYKKLHWGVAGRQAAAIEQLGVSCHLLGDDDAHYDAAEGFILLTTLEWNENRQARLIRALQQRPRPLLVGNPDLVAPHPGGLSLEPGWFAHQLADMLGIEPVFFGKPFANAFNAVLDRFPSFEPRRIAMVGDSPHTDILGGAAAGWRTVLIQQHGLCKTHDLDSVFAQCGIRPDFVAVTT